MTRALIAGLIFMAGMPLQVKHPSACDHAAPPTGMQWVCADKNSCDCHLAANSGKGEVDDGDFKLSSSASPAQCLACRIVSFAIPSYPDAARRAQKQGVVSATLVLTAEGTVQEVRIQSGEPALASAAVAALRQWRFTQGNRTESIPVSVRFVLSESAQLSVQGTSLLNTVVTATPIR